MDRPSRRHAVVVDDRLEALELLRDVLAAEPDMDVTCLSDATLDEIAAHDPDLVLLDVWLAAPDRPRGWLLARQARADPRLEGVGIVLMSADARSLRGWADEARALDIVPLAKPFALDELQAAVEAASDGSYRRVPSSP